MATLGNYLGPPGKMESATLPHGSIS